MADQGDTRLSPVNILNRSYDADFDVLVSEQVKRNRAGTAIEFFNPATEEKQDELIGNLATRWLVSGADIYLGEATAGSATSASVWRIQKIATGTGEITWADGNTSFDNSFSDPASLTYS